MDNFLLLLFALPIATIIIASVLQTVLKNPIAVALFIFAIFLIVTFAAFDSTFLVFAILYTILAFISAVITKVIIELKHDDNDENNTIAVNSVETATSGTSNTNNNNVICNCNRGYGRGFYR